jgi:hypothetical protein
MNIETHQHYPGEWTAIDSSTYDGAPDAGAMRTMGLGHTEQEAIDDLIQQFEDGKPWQQEAAREYRAANGPLGVGA